MLPLGLMNVGPWEVLVIAIIALLIFGKRLPEVAKNAGRAVTSFKEGLHEVEKDVDKAGEQDQAKKKDNSGRTAG